MENGKLERSSVPVSGSLGLNSQSLLLPINPHQSMRSGFHWSLRDTIKVARDSFGSNKMCQFFFVKPIVYGTGS